MALNGTMCITRAKCRFRSQGTREEAVLLIAGQCWPVDSFIEHGGH